MEQNSINWKGQNNNNSVFHVVKQSVLKRLLFFNFTNTYINLFTSIEARNSQTDINKSYVLAKRDTSYVNSFQHPRV